MIEVLPILVSSHLYLLRQLATMRITSMPTKHMAYLAYSGPFWGPSGYSPASSVVSVSVFCVSVLYTCYQSRLLFRVEYCTQIHLLSIFQVIWVLKPKIIYSTDQPTNLWRLSLLNVPDHLFITCSAGDCNCLSLLLIMLVFCISGTSIRSMSLDSRMYYSPYIPDLKKYLKYLTICHGWHFWRQSVGSIESV